MRVWSVAVALANHVAGLKLNGTSVELGAGCGLVGMVTGGTLVEMDEATAERAWLTLQMNKSPSTLIQASWKDINGLWDNVFASEILYPGYDSQSLVECIDRCWTRAGVCLIANASAGWRQPFEEALDKRRMPHFRVDEEFAGFTYSLWSIVR